MIAPTVIWLDMQLPPALCRVLAKDVGVPCEHISRLGMDRASDAQIFEAARLAGALVITKDSDFRGSSTPAALRRRSSGFAAETAPPR